jgi:hypothetical protein
LGGAGGPAAARLTATAAGGQKAAAGAWAYLSGTVTRADESLKAVTAPSVPYREVSRVREQRYRVLIMWG